MANDIVLETRGLVKKFGDAVILNGIDFTLHDKEVAVILGPSGCGKSTFLRCLIGLEPIQVGSILLKGKPLEFGSTLRSGIGMVFQSYDLFPHLTVLENILLAPLHVAKRSREDALAQAETLLKRVKLWDKRDFYPRQLSGGQKQRAAIVRALSMNPSVMLFDEVTASLDPEMVREVLDVIVELADSGLSMVIVTHEMEFARAVADRIVFLENGHVVEENSPEAFFTTPKTKRAAEFLKTFTYTRHKRSDETPSPKGIQQPDDAAETKQLHQNIRGRHGPPAPCTSLDLIKCRCISGGNSMSIIQNFTKKIAAVAVAAAALSAATAAVEARPLDVIKQSGEVVIGVFSDKAPFGYVDSQGKYAGYDVYFGDRLAKDLGVKVKYISVDPASRVEFLVTGKVDIILANFTVTKDRAEKVDFALPYMKVALGVVSPESAVITDVKQLDGKTLIIAKGTTAEPYFEKNHPKVKLQKYDQYTDAYNALLDGRGDAFSTDNTEVLAWALVHKGFKVGIPSLGDLDTIAPAVQKGNKGLLDWINQEIVNLGKENFFHQDYAATLAPVYGKTSNPDDLVVEGGKL